MGKKKFSRRGKHMAGKRTAAGDNLSSDAIAAAYSAATATPPIIPVFLKVCRLCESKDGPFLNIFDAEKVTAKKIDDIMPFSITENDDLPHKICFRCSAKLEELYEFVQKCINTQESLRSAVGKSGPFLSKSKMGKKLWEEKLNKTNMSNDDICDALIKKAMEGITGIPLPPEDNKEPVIDKRVTRGRESLTTKLVTEKELAKTEEKDEDIPLVQVKTILEKNETKVYINKAKRSSKPDMAETDTLEAPSKEKNKAKKSDTKKNKKSESKSDLQNEKVTTATSSKTSTNDFSMDYDSPSGPVSVKESDSEEEKKQEPEKQFNIKDHVSMIKVNGVGVLFQCKLCNRNFLRKAVVESHSCAKTGAPKVDIPKSVPVTEAPKVPSVKYIKIDSEMKKTLTEKVKMSEKVENEKQAMESNKDHEKPKTLETKPKPKIGPASKTNRNLIDLSLKEKHTTPEPQNNPTNQPPPTTTPSIMQQTMYTPGFPTMLHTQGFPITINQPVYPTMPAVQFSNITNFNSRFKLVPGPNNTFSLVEDASAISAMSQVPQMQLAPTQFHPVQYQPTMQITHSPTMPIETPPAPTPPDHTPPVPTPPVQARPVQIRPVQPSTVQENKKPGRKRKVTGGTKDSGVKLKEQEASVVSPEDPEIIDVEDQPKPYPVGLFQTVNHPQPGPAPFTTPAMKKQSYTIVQTGNPSKLLISTKANAVQEDVPKKRPRKSKLEVKEDSSSKQPFSVTLENVEHPKDSGFFTFINVDPLLQPSYVLPTDNIIQESQISSSAISRQHAEGKDSNNKPMYSCNMCNETFTREKKLMTHIQQHYTEMDQEDQARTKTSKRKGKRQ